MSQKGGKTWDLNGFWDIVVGFWGFWDNVVGFWAVWTLI
jgi:hypothetical protein